MKNIFTFARTHKPSKEQRYQAFITPLVPILLNRAFAYCGNQESAEDLLQEVLTELYTQFDKLCAAEVPKAYALRCLYFRYVDFYRKQRKLPETYAFDDEDINTGCPAPGPLDNCLSANTFAALELLTPPQRACLVLHDIEGHTFLEMAPILDMPVGTLKSHLHRARKKLKTHWQLQPSDDSLRRNKQEDPS